ncbi:MAG: hypothetical protein NWE88_07845 [Candidatus Bathyarchaeota archaeon]|nr:hypothetical protein [Candidatus Bathyarchaeota archaeon]
MPSNDPCSWNVEPLGHSDINGHGNGGQVSVAKLGGRYYAFVGHMLGMGTSILDVSDPGSPEVVAQIPIGENNHSHKVRVCGDHILVNAEQLGARRPFEAGLRIYDIRDPSSPEEVSFFEIGGKGVHKYWVDCDKKLAYIATEDEGYHEAFFMAVDFSEPEAPREVSRWWLPGQHLAGGEKPGWDTGRYSYRLHHPVVLGDRAYLGYWDAGYVILDISDLGSPEMVSRRCYTPPYGGAFHTAMPIDRRIGGRDWMVVFQESLAPYNKEGLKLMWMVDITDEENPVSVSTFSVPTEGFDLENGRLGPHQPHEDLNATDDLIYAAWFNGGLRVVSIADPFRPVEVGHHIPPVPKGQDAIWTNDAFVDDRGLVYIIDRLNRGLDILEYTGPR